MRTRPMPGSLTLVAGLGVPAFLAAGAFACITVCVGFGGAKCPPNGYGNPQPPFDCDLDGDGTNDAWCKPITLPNPAGGNFPATDSCGHTLSLPCVPHSPSNPGGPGGHFRPTIKKPGEMGPGTELGRCVYPCGRNTWKVGMCDTNGDGTPDKFMTSKWTSKDYKDTNGDRVWDTPTGRETTFCKSLAAAEAAEASSSVMPEPLVIVGTEFVDPTSPTSGRRIVDAVFVYQELTSLARVPFNGGVIADILLDAAPMAAGMAQDLTIAVDEAEPVEVSVDVASVDERSAGSREAVFRLTLRNPQAEARTFTVELRGVNMEVEGGGASSLVPPGGEWTFDVHAVETVRGKSGLAVVVHSDNADDEPMVVAAAVQPPALLADFNANGIVDASDLASLLQAWGGEGVALEADINYDGRVDSRDLALLLGAWR